MKRFALLLVMLLVAIPAGYAQPMGPMGEATTDTLNTESIQFLEEPRPEEAVAARNAWGELTIRNLMDYGSANPVPWLRGNLSLNQIAALPGDLIMRLVDHISARQAAMHDLRNHPELVYYNPMVEQWERTRDQLIVNRFVETELEAKLVEPPEAVVTAYYEEHKPEFKQNFGFKMRHLILLTYEPYIVAEGDTLESIAEKISGDAANADNIRADIAGKPARREEGEVFKPLVPGEQLLVPMDEADAQQVRQRLEEILKELDEGQTFEELAKQYSETEPEARGQVIGWLPAGTRDMLPDLLEMGRQTPVGEISPIFRTKHGWQVIEVVDKREEGFRPLEDVRSTIEMRLKQEKRDELIQELLDRLMLNPALEINYDALTTDADATTDTMTVVRRTEPSTDTVVASVGDRKIYYGEIAQGWSQVSPPIDREKVRGFLREMGKLQINLIVEEMRPFYDDPASTLARQLEWMEVGFLGSNKINHVARLRAMDAITDEMKRNYFAEHREEFATPEMVAYSTMERRLSPEQQALEGEARQAAVDQLKEMMTADLADVKSAEDFINLAGQVNETLLQQGVRIPQAADPVPVDRIEEPIAAQIAELQEGEFSQPFVVGDQRVLSVLVEKRQPAGIPEYEAVASQVENRLLPQLFREYGEAVEREYLEQAQVEHLITE
ncbi:MAG TPA: peptidylprolyl isomerase [Candidatus Sumerlaeota bacterium]|nr:peptidylprolyl isomerase [Candidatus Sumerlaeota bacterium]HOR26751.1 peptidylprolyl isomerase [Candidatus Sumerlaeota bacterium]